MSQVVQTNGNYKIKTALNGQIILDTGPTIGQVVVTGNLIVKGNTTIGDVTNVAVVDMKVEDNIITLNSGESGNGVTLNYAGIEIDRGQVDKAAIVFDESTNTWLFAKGQNGTYNFTDNNSIKLSNITFTDTSDPDGYDIRVRSVAGPGTGVLRIFDIENYEDYVLNNNDIPNKRYVDRRIIERPAFQIIRDDSRVIVEDIDETEDPLLLESKISTYVDSNLIMTAYSNRIDIQNLRFYTNIVENPGTNENIILKTSGTGRVEMDYALQYNHTGSTPANVTGATLVYGDTPSPEGGSGVYFVNEQVSGELISKRKALTFSLIF
jgi:predicted nucleic-acid-binding Zn-ribbon protein